MGVAALAANDRGCGVDNCHGLSTKYTLAVETKNVKGHPAVAETSLYQDCLKCHNEKMGKLDFAVVLHKVHYHEGTNHFTSNPKYTCKSCHSIDLGTGKVSVQYAK